MKALLAASDLISVLAVALPLFVTTLTVARNRLSGEQTSLIFIDVFMFYEDPTVAFISKEKVEISKLALSACASQSNKNFSAVFVEILIVSIESFC